MPSSFRSARLRRALCLPNRAVVGIPDGHHGQGTGTVLRSTRFAIEEAHKRGLELHAWFNPYRVRLRSAASPVAANHVSKTRPQLVREYGEFLWLHPGGAVQDYSLSVVMDVVKRYDVDGIHFDDYFYPYKARDRAGKELDFPDNASWQRSGVAGKMSRDDWRRENVNNFIQQVHKSIKTTKPWVKFGISPFWHLAPQLTGPDQRPRCLRDPLRRSRRGLINGWADYFAPQLYWAIEPPAQSLCLAQWWAEQNPKGRTLCPGMNSTKVSGPSPSSSGWSPQEIVTCLTRKQAGVGGYPLNMGRASARATTPPARLLSVKPTSNRR